MRQFERMFAKRHGIVIKYTTECNLKCKYCYQKQNNGFVGKTTEFKMLDAIFYDIKNYYADIETPIDLTIIGGEITTNIELLKKTINHINNCNINFNSITITTNAVCDKDVMLLFSELKCRYYRIIVSLDFNKEIHDRNRIAIDGSGTYEIVFNNLKYLIDKTDSDILISSVMNIDSLRDIYISNNANKYLNYDKELLGIHIKKNINIDYDKTFNEEANLGHKMLVDTISENMINLLNSNVKPSEYNHVTIGGLDIFHILDILYGKDYKRRMCDLGYVREYLPDGSISLCCHSNEVNNKQFQGGHILDKNIDNYSEMILKHVDDTTSCLKCEMLGICAGSCANVSGNHMCIPWRRKQAQNMKDGFVKILSIDNFFDKFTNVLIELSKTSNNMHFLNVANFYINNYDDVNARILNIFGVKI